MIMTKIADFLKQIIRIVDVFGFISLLYVFFLIRREKKFSKKANSIKAKEAIENSIPVILFPSLLQMDSSLFLLSTRNCSLCLKTFFVMTKLNEFILKKKKNLSKIALNYIKNSISFLTGLNEHIKMISFSWCHHRR